MNQDARLPHSSATARAVLDAGSPIHRPRFCNPADPPSRVLSWPSTVAARLHPKRERTEPAPARVDSTVVARLHPQKERTEPAPARPDSCNLRALSGVCTAAALVLLAFGCTSKPTTAPKEPASTTGALAIVGGRLRLPDGTLAPRTIHTRAGVIFAIDQEPPTAGEASLDASGLTLLPAFIDSHVHITFSAPEFELQGGIAAALDLGAPASLWDEAPKMLPLRLYPSGQLITAPGGYPTQGWGRDGYGREVEGPEQALAAVREFADRGAKLIKMPLEPNGGPLLSSETQRALVEAAHGRGLPVGSHAMSAETVKMALTAGVDLLVHAPLERLDDTTIKSFCGRPKAAVISTFEAFALGGSAQENVRRMKGAGCTILYGSDLGNGVSAGLLPAELVDLVGAGLSASEAIDAATRSPARYFGFSDLGELAPGKAASVLGVEGNPYEDISAMESLRLVVIAGQKIER